MKFIRLGCLPAICSVKPRVVVLKAQVVVTPKVQIVGKKEERSQRAQFPEYFLEPAPQHSARMLLALNIMSTSPRRVG